MDKLLSEKLLNVFSEEEVSEDHLVAGHHFRGENERNGPADSVRKGECLQSWQPKMVHRLVATVGRRYFRFVQFTYCIFNRTKID